MSFMSPFGNLLDVYARQQFPQMPAQVQQPQASPTGVAPPTFTNGGGGAQQFGMGSQQGGFGATNQGNHNDLFSGLLNALQGMQQGNKGTPYTSMGGLLGGNPATSQTMNMPTTGQQPMQQPQVQPTVQPTLPQPQTLAQPTPLPTPGLPAGVGAQGNGKGTIHNDLAPAPTLGLGMGLTGTGGLLSM